MKNVLIPKIEKTADYNLKDSFSSNSVQEKIIEYAFKAMPLLKSLNYALYVKNKDMSSGDMIAILNIEIPATKNPAFNMKLNIPIFIKDYFMKPIDTIVLNNVAFPISDGTIKELLNNPENFRTLTMQEMKQSRILSKLAEADAVNLSKELDEYIKNAPSDEEKLLAITQKKGVEEYMRLEKAAEDYSEPIFECILEKKANHDFDLFYTRMLGHNEKLEFVKDNLSPKEANLFLKTIGYNEKIAEKATKKGGTHLKAPVSRPNESHESVMYDPAKIDKIKTVDQLESGPCEIMDESGNKLEGILYDLQSFTNAENAFAENKLFFDYDKNYCINTDFQGMPTENPRTLEEDVPGMGSQGVFVDEINDIAYGPITINSFIDSGDDSKMFIKFKNKRFELKKVAGLKRNVLEGDTIMIPKSLRWYAFQREIKIVGNVGELVTNKFANASYKIAYHNATDTYQVTKVKDNLNKIANIPNSNHLKLFLSRINLIADDLEKVADSIAKGHPITFITDYPMASVFNETFEKRSKKPILHKIEGIDEQIKNIKIASKQLSAIFTKLFEIAREPDATEILDQTAESILAIDPELPTIKEAATFDTLDSIFALNVINNTNSAVFLNSINKLKGTLSLLSALRIYLRFGWQVDIAEADVNQAIDALLDIIKSLELVKTQRVLEKQEQNKI